MDADPRVRWADVLTISRGSIAPLLIATAVSGAHALFVALVAWGLLSDGIDGTVARKLGHASPRGAVLDSRCDLLFYTAVIAGTVLLIPEQVYSERYTIAAGVAGYLIPIAAGWLRFGRLTAYHTILARASLILLLPCIALWLAFDLPQAFRFGTAMFLLSGIEELIITASLTEWQSGIPHVGRVLTRHTAGQSTTP